MNRSRTYLTPNRHEKYMVVDGYNIINAWESLKKFINDDLDFAREKLIHLLMEYGQYEKYDITIVLMHNILMRKKMSKKNLNIVKWFIQRKKRQLIVILNAVYMKLLNIMVEKYM